MWLELRYTVKYDTEALDTYPDPNGFVSRPGLMQKIQTQPDCNPDIVGFKKKKKKNLTDITIMKSTKNI